MTPPPLAKTLNVLSNPPCKKNISRGYKILADSNSFLPVCISHIVVKMCFAHQSGSTGYLVNAIHPAHFDTSHDAYTETNNCWLLQCYASGYLAYLSTSILVTAAMSRWHTGTLTCHASPASCLFGDGRFKEVHKMQKIFRSWAIPSQGKYFKFSGNTVVVWTGHTLIRLD